MTLVRRGIVTALWRMDDYVDWILLRPVTVQLFSFLPRWWQCELAKLSERLDERWKTGVWNIQLDPNVNERLIVGPVCDACRKRASSVTVGPMGEGGDTEGHEQGFFDTHEIGLCSWCAPEFRDEGIESEADLQKELERVRDRTVSWRWS